MTPANFSKRFAKPKWACWLVGVKNGGTPASSQDKRSGRESGSKRNFGGRWTPENCRYLGTDWESGSERTVLNVTLQSN